MFAVNEIHRVINTPPPPPPLSLMYMGTCMGMKRQENVPVHKWCHSAMITLEMLVGETQASRERPRYVHQHSHTHAHTLEYDPLKRG